MDTTQDPAAQVPATDEPVQDTTSAPADDTSLPIEPVVPVEPAPEIEPSSEPVSDAPESAPVTADEPTDPESPESDSNATEGSV